MATCQTAQWESTSPYVKLTVTESAATGNTATLSWTLQYIAAYAACVSYSKAYAVTIAGETVKSGYFDIDGKTGTHMIASGEKVINKTTAAQTVAFGCSMAFNLTWTDTYAGTLSASGTISVAAKTKYTVSYNANGGSGAPGSQTKYHGDTLTISSTKPTRTGHTFQGWATSASGSVVYAAGAKYTSNASITLYAVWKANTFAVTFNVNGGTGAPAAQTKVYGQTLKLSTVKPKRTDYIFTGWATSASGAVAYQPGDSYTGNDDLTLYAQWVKAYNKPRVEIKQFDRVLHTQEVMPDGSTLVTSAISDEGKGFRFWLTYETDVEAVSVVVEWRTSTGDWNATNSREYAVTGTSGSVMKDIMDVLDVENSYTFRFTVNDSTGNTPIIRQLGSAALHIDFMPPASEGDRGGVSIGKTAELEGVFDVALATLARGGFMNPIIEPETDLNDVVLPNTYIGANISNYNYGNCPLKSGTFTLTVESAGEEGQLKQILTRCSKTEPERFIRFFYQSVWGEWQHDQSAVIYARETGTDLNEYMQTGVWFFNTSYTPANVPSGCVNGWLIVLRADSGAIKQFWLRYGTLEKNDFNTFVRTSNGTEWSAWRNLAADPVVLYNSDAGTSGTVEINGEYSMSNYEYIEIFYTDNNGKSGGYTRVYSPYNKNVTLSLIEPSAADKTLIRRTEYAINLWYITPITERAGYVNINASSASHVGAGTNYIKIARVLGHFKR